VPIHDGVGHGPSTLAKLEHFDGLVKMHAHICAGIQRRYGRHYHYLDVNSGIGYAGEHDGTPVRAARIIDSIVPRYSFYAVDKNPQVTQLGERLDSLSLRGDVKVEWGDNRLTVRPYAESEMKKDAQGLLLHDPNGVVDFDLPAPSFEAKGRLPPATEPP
jgi:hypothetical protein